MPNNAIAAAIEALAADHARYTPSPDELAAAPLITNYTISPTELGGRYRLEGTVQGHPVVGDTLVGTSPIMAMDPLMMWARTRSRYYRLGKAVWEKSNA